METLTLKNKRKTKLVRNPKAKQGRVVQAKKPKPKPKEAVQAKPVKKEPKPQPVKQTPENNPEVLKQLIEKQEVFFNGESEAPGIKIYGDDALKFYLALRKKHKVWRQYRPLALGVTKSLKPLANKYGMKSKQVQAMLYHHTSQPRYLHYTATTKIRYNLDGTFSSLITKQHAKHARKMMKQHTSKLTPEEKEAKRLGYKEWQKQKDAEAVQAQAGESAPEANP